MNTEERIAELQEKKDEYILNESVIPDPCSWGELAEAQAEAESRWNETEEGKELKALLSKRTTKVIFRVHNRRGETPEVVAFFPELPGTNDPYDTCLCYAHVGQHSSASMEYYLFDTRPASTEEFKDLLDELQEIYEGNLRVYQHMVASDAKKRIAACQI